MVGIDEFKRSIVEIFHQPPGLQPLSVLPQAWSNGSVKAAVCARRFQGGHYDVVWDVPAGKYTLLRVACSNHGQELIVPSPNSKGPMIDFIDPAATEFYMRFIADKILAKLGRKDFHGSAMRYFEVDGMELASQAVFVMPPLARYCFGVTPRMSLKTWVK